MLTLIEMRSKNENGGVASPDSVSIYIDDLQQVLTFDRVKDNGIIGDTESYLPIHLKRH